MAKKSFFEHLSVAGKEKKEADEVIKNKIVIDVTLQQFIFPLLAEEIQQLEANILAEGCRDPLVVWKNAKGNYVLVDGHNRYSICTKHKLHFNIKVQNFENVEAVKDWMIGNQLGRRNVTPEQASYLRGLQYNRSKKKKRLSEPRFPVDWKASKTRLIHISCLIA